MSGQTGATQYVVEAAELALRYADTIDWNDPQNISEWVEFAHTLTIPGYVIAPAPAVVTNPCPYCSRDLALDVHQMCDAQAEHDWIGDDYRCVPVSQIITPEVREAIKWVVEDVKNWRVLRAGATRDNDIAILESVIKGGAS